MSFGFSPSDIVTLTVIVTKCYKGWRDACGEYADMTTSLEQLLDLIRQIHEEVDNEHSILARDSNDAAALGALLQACRRTAEELGEILDEYRLLGYGKSRRKNWIDLQTNWTRSWFGHKDLNTLRSRLQHHVAMISAHLSAAGVSALSRVKWDVKTLPEPIQRTIDGLAAVIRAGRRDGSIMTSYDDDEKEVWKQFRRELVGEGIRSSTIHQLKPRIKDYLRMLSEQGMLEEASLPGSESDVSTVVNDLADEPEQPSQLFSPTSTHQIHDENLWSQTPAGARSVSEAVARLYEHHRLRGDRRSGRSHQQQTYRYKAPLIHQRCAKLAYLRSASGSAWKRQIVSISTGYSDLDDGTAPSDAESMLLAIITRSFEMMEEFLLEIMSNTKHEHLVKWVKADAEELASTQLQNVNESQYTLILEPPLVPLHRARYDLEHGQRQHSQSIDRPEESKSYPLSKRSPACRGKRLSKHELEQIIDEGSDPNPHTIRMLGVFQLVSPIGPSPPK